MAKLTNKQIAETKSTAENNTENSLEKTPNNADQSITAGNSGNVPPEKILFINSYYATDDILRGYNKKILAARFQKQFWLLTAVFAVLLIPCLVTGDRIALGLVLACLVLSVAVNLLAPRLMLRQLRNMQQRLHNGKTPKTTVSFGKAIRLQEGRCDLTMDYAQIMEIYFLPEIYVLMYAKDNGVMLKSDGFTQGTAEEFRSFITGLCPIAKIYNK